VDSGVDAVNRILVSVVIPTANRSKLLAQLLDALRRQILDQPFEIIVVNDSEQTEVNDLSFAASFCKCTVVRGEGKGPARARNLGASHAIGTFLVFLDDDSVVDPSYLARIVERLQERPGYALAGPQRSIDRRNSFALAAEWLADSFTEAERFDSNRFGFAPSNGFALRPADFHRTGGFNPQFPLASGEDREFCTRWIASGLHIDVLEELAIQHRFPATLSAFVQQQSRYGRGVFQYAACVAADRRPRVRSIRFYWGVVFGPLKRHGLRRGVPVCFLAAFSQLVVWAGYMRERISKPAKSRRAVTLAANGGSTR
jgi:cellulose synthase/poly-beta-1,6-N-acetylglucosamine synthase-like glycosyltransferase